MNEFLKRMKSNKSKTALCQITKKEFPLSELMPGISVREPIAELIRQGNNDWDPNQYISVSELEKYRNRYIKNLLEKEKGELNKLELEVLDSIKHSKILSENVNEIYDEKLKFSGRMADKLAEIGGSWPFILIFFFFILLWMLLNSYFLINRSFDPYPYIFLNLILSCIAAIQAPVIIMSQNRQETKDRLRSQYDYQVNLKAELEIRQLHEKMDHLLINQGQRLLEIQQLQMDVMSEILDTVKNKK